MPMRPCWVEIDQNRLQENYRLLQSLAAPHAELLAVVKANAYGHSLELCAPAAVRAGANWLGVTSVEEGVAARALCPTAQILVIGGVFPGQGSEAISSRLTTVAWEPWQLEELSQPGAPAGSIPVHLEMDTGMSRQGVALQDLASILTRFRAGSPLALQGVMTHLFAADESDGQVTREQLERLEQALRIIGEAGLLPNWLNVGNSAALASGQAAVLADLAARYGMLAMLRPGLALYGLVPRFSPSEPAPVAKTRSLLKPVLSWKTRLTGVRSIPAGAVVGYNGSFVATEPMRLALIAAGYADGLDRRLGNRMSLLVRGERAPLVGRVNMDQAVLDVTGIPEVAAGDEVVILGDQGEDSISAFDLAEIAETIPWQIFTGIGPRVPRIAV